MPPDALEITRKPVRILVKEDELTLQCIKQFYGQCGEGRVEAVLPSMTISTYLGYYTECYLCEHQRKVDNKIRGRDHRFSYTWTHGLAPPPRLPPRSRSLCKFSKAAKMVLKTELCRFSGQKIYPGKGIRFIRADSQVFLFANSKCKRYHHNKLKPAKLTWTAVYRKQHKKDIHAEAAKKRRRTTKKPYSRSIVGATLEVIQKKRAEKPEVRDAAREAALREIKERIKKTKDEKKAKKAEVTKSQKSQGKGAVQKGSKGPKLGGGGGKR